MYIMIQTLFFTFSVHVVFVFVVVCQGFIQDFLPGGGGGDRTAVSELLGGGGGRNKSKGSPPLCKTCTSWVLTASHLSFTPGWTHLTWSCDQRVEPKTVRFPYGNIRNSRGLFHCYTRLQPSRKLHVCHFKTLFE